MFSDPLQQRGPVLALGVPEGLTTRRTRPGVRSTKLHSSSDWSNLASRYVVVAGGPPMSADSESIDQADPPELRRLIFGFLNQRFGARIAAFVLATAALVAAVAPLVPQISGGLSTIWSEYRRNHPSVPAIPPGKLAIGLQIAGPAERVDKVLNQLRTRLWGSDVELVQIGTAGGTADPEDFDALGRQELEVRQWLERTGAAGVFWGRLLEAPAGPVLLLHWTPPTYSDTLQSEPRWSLSSTLMFPAVPARWAPSAMSFWISAQAKQYHREIRRGIIESSAYDQADANEVVQWGEALCGEDTQSNGCKAFARLQAELHVMGPAWDALWQKKGDEGYSILAFYRTTLGDTPQGFRDTPHIASDYEALLLSADLRMADAAQGLPENTQSDLEDAVVLLSFHDWQIGTDVLRTYPLSGATLQFMRGVVGALKSFDAIEEKTASLTPHTIAAISRDLDIAAGAVKRARTLSGDDFTIGRWEDILQVNYGRLAQLARRIRQPGALDSDVFAAQQGAPDRFLQLAIDHGRAAVTALGAYEFRTPRRLTAALTNYADLLRLGSQLNPNYSASSVGVAARAVHIAEQTSSLRLEEEATRSLSWAYGSLGGAHHEPRSYCMALLLWDKKSRIHGSEGFSLGSNEGENATAKVMKDFAQHTTRERFEECLMRASMDPKAVYSIIGSPRSFWDRNKIPNLPKRKT